MAKTLFHPNPCLLLREISENQVIVGATQPTELFFIGVLNVEVLVGLVEIMGFRLSSKHPSISVCSSKENCVLKITMAKEISKSVINESRLRESNIPECLVHFISDQSLSHVVLFTKNESCYPSISLLKFYEMPVFVKENIQASVASSLQTDVSKYLKYKENVEWYRIVSTLLEKRHPRTVLCGGRGVGKSTLLKFLINRCLEKWPELIVIDLDPGQAEFTVMGCLSVVLVRQPITGPNFSHLVTPDKCLFFGDISVSNSPEHYVRYLKNLTNHCNENHRRIPWFINTMGFTEGLGAKLLYSALESILPTDVVQISSKLPSNNFSRKLSPNFWTCEGYTKSKFANYTLHFLESVAESRDESFDASSWGLSSLTKRNIVTLSYFSSVIKSTDGNLLNAVPRNISLSSVRIFVDNPSLSTPVELNKFQSICCINANLVALCHCSVNDDLIECNGYGIVRGYDDATDDLFIITPLNDSQLRNVNVICMNSSIQLPEIIYTKQMHSVRNSVPYVTHVPVDILHQLVKKSSSRLKHGDTQNEGTLHW